MKIKCSKCEEEFENGSGNSMYEWIIKNKYPNNPPLQVLCMNCNFEKN